MNDERDIVYQLRRGVVCPDCGRDDFDPCSLVAADEIERLRAEVAHWHNAASMEAAKRSVGEFKAKRFGNESGLS